jgi:hypothetical protein
MTEGPDAPVSVGTVFERFPASVRGAIVVRGADPDPHQVRLAGAEVVEGHGSARTVCPVSVDPVTIDVAPRAEVVIPFDVSLAGIPPGWYGVTAEVVVDGQQTVRGPADGKRFTVPWPSGEVRRGEVQANVRIAVPGSDGAVVERIECKADRAVVRWRHRPGKALQEPEFGELRVVAGTKRLPVVDSAYDPATGARSTVVYPILKSHRELRFELDRRFPRGKPPQRGKWSASLALA